MRLADWIAVLFVGCLSLISVSVSAQEQEKTIIIRGVVDARGPASFIEQGDTDWRGVAHLVAWRVEGQDGADGADGADGEVRLHPLRVEMPKMDESNAAGFQLSFTDRTMVRFTIRGPIKAGEMHDVAILGETLALKPDTELRAIAEDRLNPPPFTDLQFGTFTPERRFPEWFKQERQWQGRTINVTLALDYNGPPKPDSLERALDSMRAMWSRINDWDERMQAAIVEEYYDVWANNWRAEGEPAISREAFKQRFSLEGLSFYPDGGMSAMYSDDDLFGGHGMAVDYDADTGSFNVSMFG